MNRRKHMEDSMDRYIEFSKLFSNSQELKTTIKNKPEEGLKLFDKYFKTNEEMNVSMQNLYKVYDNGIQAITNLSLEIKPKEFVCLLGPSGCGKTTLLRMIAGLETISAGNLAFNDKVVNATVPSKRGISMVFQNYALYPYMNVAKNISFGLKIEVRKNDQLRRINALIKSLRNKNHHEISELKEELRSLKKPLEYEIVTLRENNKLLRFNKQEQLARKKGQEKLASLIAENKILRAKNADKIEAISQQIKTLTSEGKITGSDVNHNTIAQLRKSKRLLTTLCAKTIDLRTKKVCDTVGIGQFLNRKPSELSGGQRQRVALARTISKNRKLFLFDEPLSNLDAKLRGGMRKLIRQLHENTGATSIYVTHDQIEAMTMADKVVVMKAGFIQQIDTPLNLFLNPANLFVAKFIGTPEINTINATFDNKETITVGKTKLKITKSNVHDVTKETDRKVVLGIRPQHIITDHFIVDQQKSNVIRAKIESMQLLGNEYQLTVSHPDLGEFDLNVTSYENPVVGGDIKCYINANKIILFDRATEKNITTIFNDETESSIQNWFDKAIDRDKNEAIMQKQLSKKSIGKKIVKSIASSVAKKKEHAK